MPALPMLRLATNESSYSNNTLMDHENSAHRSTSPSPPPYSPITPIMSATRLYENNTSYSSAPPSDTTQQRPLLSLTESENSDAIALRSAISILQIQRQQTLRDLKTLEQQKKVALANPEAFIADVVAGKVKTSSTGIFSAGSDPESQDKEPGIGFAQSPWYSDEDDDRPQSKTPKSVIIPGPQDIVRTPPINWAKYHIVGKSLDKLHGEQQARPNPGQPRRDEELIRPPEHVIAAPYNPWNDKLTTPPMRTRSFSKRDD